MENLQKRIEKYAKLQCEIRNEAAYEIKEAVIRNDGKIEFDPNDDNEYMSIPCNGNMDAVIHSLEMDEGRVSVMLDDTWIPLDYMLADEVIDLYDMLFNYTLPRIENIQNNQ